MSIFNTGTCTVLSGQNSIVFGGVTNAQLIAAVDAGSLFVIAGDSVPYVVSSVDPTLAKIYLTANYGGTSTSGSYYEVYKDFSANAGLASMYGGGMGDWPAIMGDIISKIDQWAIGWNQVPFTCSFASGTTFTCAGDKTSKFTKDLRLKIVHAGGTTYHNVVSSAYSSATTVTIDGTTLQTPISRVYHSLVSAGSSGAAPTITSRFATAINGDTTPAVSGIDVLYLANNPAVIITAFDNGTEGQTLRVCALSGDAGTIVSGCTGYLAGGANWGATDYDTLTLLKGPNSWYELARSANS